MKVSRSWQRASGIRAGLAALLVAGCVSPVEPPVPLFWTGTVQADPAAPFWIGGTAEMVANPGDTSVGIFLDADPEEDFPVSWEVRNGPCSGSGERIAPAAVFPPITLAADRRGIGLATIRRRIPAGTYAVEVFAEADGGGDRLACAELSEFTGS